MSAPPATSGRAAAVTPRYEALRERVLARPTGVAPRDLAVLLSRGVAAWMQFAPTDPPSPPSSVSTSLQNPDIVRVMAAMTLAHAPDTELPA